MTKPPRKTAADTIADINAANAAFWDKRNLETVRLLAKPEVAAYVDAHLEADRTRARRAERIINCAPNDHDRIEAIRHSETIETLVVQAVAIGSKMATARGKRPKKKREPTDEVKAKASIAMAQVRTVTIAAMRRARNDDGRTLPEFLEAGTRDIEVKMEMHGRVEQFAISVRTLSEIDPITFARSTLEGWWTKAGKAPTMS